MNDSMLPEFQQREVQRLRLLIADGTQPTSGDILDAIRVIDELMLRIGYLEDEVNPLRAENSMLQTQLSEAMAGVRIARTLQGNRDEPPIAAPKGTKGWQRGDQTWLQMADGEIFFSSGNRWHSVGVTLADFPGEDGYSQMSIQEVDAAHARFWVDQNRPRA